MFLHRAFAVEWLRERLTLFVLLLMLLLFLFVLALFMGLAAHFARYFLMLFALF